MHDHSEQRFLVDRLTKGTVWKHVDDSSHHFTVVVLQSYQDHPYRGQSQLNGRLYTYHGPRCYLLYHRKLDDSAPHEKRVKVVPLQLLDASQEVTGPEADAARDAVRQAAAEYHAQKDKSNSG